MFSELQSSVTSQLENVPHRTQTRDSTDNNFDDDD